MFSIITIMTKLGNIFNKLSLDKGSYDCDGEEDTIKDAEYAIDSSKDVSGEFVFMRVLPDYAETQVEKEFSILNTILVNNYGILDISCKIVEEEFNKYRELGFNFLDQKQSLIANISAYMSNYASDAELRNMLSETILNKQACIDEMMGKIPMNNTHDDVLGVTYYDHHGVPYTEL